MTLSHLCVVTHLNKKVLAPLHANEWLRSRRDFSSPFPCDALVIRLLFKFQECCCSAESLCEIFVHIHTAAVQGERASVGDEQEVAQSSRRRCGDNRRTDEQQVRSGCSDSQDGRCNERVAAPNPFPQRPRAAALHTRFLSCLQLGRNLVFPLPAHLESSLFLSRLVNYTCKRRH